MYGLNFGKSFICCCFCWMVSNTNNITPTQSFFRMKSSWHIFLDRATSLISHTTLLRRLNLYSFSSKYKLKRMSIMFNTLDAITYLPEMTHLFIFGRPWRILRSEICMWLSNFVKISSIWHLDYATANRWSHNFELVSNIANIPHDHLRNFIVPFTGADTVAFRVNSVLIAEDGEPVVFEDVEFDIGGTYNSTTGLFTAPVHGLYILTTQLCGRCTEETFCGFGLLSDSSEIQSAIIEFQNTTYCATAIALAVLDIGTEVGVYITNFQTFTDIISNDLNSMTGALIEKYAWRILVFFIICLS